jgi:hypothetical protein
VSSRDVDWDDLFAAPCGQKEYDEAAFRQLASQCGWRLTRIVPATEKERRLYFERPY